MDDCVVPWTHTPECADAECTGCAAAFADDYMLLCRYHYKHTVAALYALPALDQALTLASTTPAGAELTERMTNKSASVGITLIEAVIATKDSLREDLALFASYLIVELGLPRLERQTVDAMVTLIGRHSLTIASDPVTARAFATKIVSARDDAQRHAYPSRSTRMKLCACECGRALRYERGQATVRCRGCGVTHDLATLEAAHAPDESARFTARETLLFVAAKTGRLIPEGTLRQWASTGKIDRAGKDRRGRTLYSPLQALAVATGGAA